MKVSSWGKQVFCSKRNPNCSACPLRPQCEYAQANGRHLKKPPGPSNMPIPEATPAQAGPASSEATKSPQQKPSSDSPNADALEADRSRAQDAAPGPLKGTGNADDQKQAEEGISEAADLLEEPCTPGADRRTDAAAADKERQSLLKTLDSGVVGPETPTKSTEGRTGARPLADNRDMLESRGASDDNLACEAEADLPDIEDLEKAAAPSKAPRTQIQELARILDTGEGYERALIIGQDTDPCGHMPLRCGVLPSFRCKFCNTTTYKNPDVL